MNARDELYDAITVWPPLSQEAFRLVEAFRAEVLREAADAVAKATGNPQDANAKLLRRMADGAAPGGGDTP